MKNVLVIFGGRSVEHDISIITAMQVLKNLPAGINFIPIYIDKDQNWWQGTNLDDPTVYLNFAQNCKHKQPVTLICGKNRLFEVKKGVCKKPMAIDAAIVCCHGGDGEGGALQGLLKMCKIPFTCPDFKSSVLCMDKILSKQQLSQNGIKVVEYVWFLYADFLQNKNFYISKVEKEIGYPLIVKPARLGSSVGVHVCSSRQEFFTALEIAAEFDDKILVEKYLSGCKEFACACMTINGKLMLSQVSQISKGEIYSFEEKYLSSCKGSKKPNKSMQEEIEKLCKKAYKTLECEGLVRVDFLYSPQSKNLYVCEVNTIPGSLAFNLFKDISFSDLIANIVEEAINSNKKDDLLYDFSSDAIEHFIEINALSKNSK